MLDQFKIKQFIILNIKSKESFFDNLDDIDKYMIKKYLNLIISKSGLFRICALIFN